MNDVTVKTEEKKEQLKNAESRGTLTNPREENENGWVGDYYVNKANYHRYLLKQSGVPGVFPEDPKGDNDSFRYVDSLIGSNWVSFIDDDANISHLSIPGTNNSCTYTLSDSMDKSFKKTQDDSVLMQLESGVRYLDACCRHIDDSFSMHHDSYYLNLRFGEMLADCYRFLNANPDEFIIIRVKSEYNPSNNTRGFADTFEALYYNPSRMVQFFDDSLPTVGEARGKVIIFQRFYGQSVGFDLSNWQDDATFDMRGFIHIQDKHSELHLADKENQVLACLDVAKRFSSPSNGWLTINGVNMDAYVPFHDPEYFANEVNPRIAGFIWDDRNKHPYQSLTYGIVVMDYSDSSGNGLVSQLVASNFAIK